MSVVTPSVPGTSLEKIAGLSSLPEVLSLLVAERKALVPEVITPQLPSPVILTPTEIVAVKKAAALIQSDLCPPRRTLETTEITTLLSEREQLDLVEKAVVRRKDALKTAVLNHLDVALEEGGGATEVPRNDKGHYIINGAVAAPGAPKKFSKEVRKSAPVLTTEALEAQVQPDEDESIFTHDDYLACTTQLRVIDEAKVMLHLRKKPEIIAALQAAITADAGTISLNLRPSK